MPQCQRSPNNTILEAARHEVAAGVWMCPGAPYSPGCQGGEIYADVTEGRLAERCLFVAALERCRTEFDRRPSSRPRLWLGVRPLTIRNADGSIDIYLTTGSDDLQLRYQCAQEVFHAVAGPATLHWTHEMLSLHFALRQLRAEGDDSYADIQEARLRDLAEEISTSDLVEWSNWPSYPPVSIYGRAFVLGEQLIEVTRWEDVKRLISADVEEWLGTLGPPERVRAQSVLGLS